ncbi:MAG: 1-acyl-sn-glycerol-3-phosphate acyltransferase [Bacteroidetes bacterium]|nr:1-acyl-sn-glycerol-3-phosphate acyltransferase [Bacteroidota bacterium]MCW5894713.1 1-acyl-sn-glycerol-3-phosphate acyltransferase [Bacteroidota bacterium]
MKKIIGSLRFLGLFSLSMFFASIILLTLIFTRSSRVFHGYCRMWARSVLFVCGVKVTVRGVEHLRNGNGFVYVSNHAGMFDIPSVIAGIPDQIRIVYKKELEKIPIFGWGLKFGSYIAIDRGRGVQAQRSLEEAIGKIRNGESVLLFAEGTRTLDGKLQSFKRGAFHIAVQAGVPVVPLTINGSFTILPKHSISINPGHVELILDTPIHLTGQQGKESELTLMEEVHAAIEKHYVNQ